MIQNSTFSTRLYLFFITFLALIAVFPILTELVISTFFGEVFFYTPGPDNTARLMGIIITGSLLAIGIIWLFRRKDKTEQLEEITIGVLRYTLVFAMVGFYGYAKLLNKQFHINYSSLETPLKDVPPFYLTWYFFGRSNIEVLLFALLEIIPGILLLFRRTTFIGAALLFPFMINVFLVNVFNEISWLTLRYSLMFVLFDTGILLFYRKEIRELFIIARHKLGMTFQKSRAGMIFKCIKITFICMLLFRFGFGVYKSRHELKSKCNGAYELAEISYDNKPYVLDSLDDYWKELYFEKRSGWNFMLKNKANDRVIMRYTFYENRDSLKILAYTGFDEKDNPLDSIVFRGHYFLENNDTILRLSGRQNDKLMKAVYHRLPMDGYDWWW